MRVAPIGLAYHCNPERAADVAREAARITHSHPIGEDGAALQAAAVAERLWELADGLLDLAATAE